MELSLIKHQSHNNLKLNIILTLSGKLVSLFGTQIYTFAMGLYILKDTGSGLSFALSLILSALPRIILGPIAGILADRMDRKKIVIGTDLLCGLLMFAFLALNKITGPHLYYIYIFSLLLTSANTFFDVAFSASLTNIVDDKSLMRMSSLNQSISSSAAIAAPFLGGVIFGLVDLNLFILINGLSFIGSAIAEMFINFSYNQNVDRCISNIDTPPATSFIRELKDSFAFLRSNKPIYILFGFALFMNFFFVAGLDIPYPYIVNHVLQLTSSQFGVIESMFPLGMLAASIILSILPEAQRKFPLLVAGTMTMSLLLPMVGVAAMPGILPLGSTAAFVYFLILAGIFGMSNIVVNVPIGVIMQRLIPNSMKGKFFGMLNTMAMGITPLAMLVSGALLDHIPAYILPITSGGVLIIIVCLIAINKEIQKL